VRPVAPCVCWRQTPSRRRDYVSLAQSTSCCSARKLHGAASSSAVLMGSTCWAAVMAPSSTQRSTSGPTNAIKLPVRRVERGS